MYPRVEIELNKIEKNALLLTEKFNERGIDVIGVTKVCLGEPQIARAMIRGGVSGIGDSRIANLKRLREADLGVPIMMLRLPCLSEAEEVVTLTDVSLNSELETIRVLSKSAKKHNKTHSVIIMVETGDRREGVNPQETLHLVQAIAELPNIELTGLGTNVACLEGVSPTPERLSILTKLKNSIEQKLGIKVPIVSGGNSSAWKVLKEDLIPFDVNQVRLGEAILLGRETIKGEAISGCYQDVFTLRTEVIELNRKNVGAKFITPTACRQAIVAIGKQDTDIEGLMPRDPAIRIIKASSDHLVLNVSNAKETLSVGDIVSFDLEYQALLRAMTSPFVKAIIRGKK